MGLAIYPVKLSPLYLPHPWAGGLLEGYYCPGPSVPAPPAGIAEVWTTLDDGARQTVVANGPLKGTPLGDLVRQAPQYVVGRRHRASQPFPVCLRILDVGQDQPLLVHPAEDLLADQPSPAPANAKFWYCLTHSPEASIMVGIRPRVTRLQFVQSLNSPGLRDLLQGFPARQGDSFFIPAGQVHSIGTGNLVCELQQRPVPPELVSGWSAAEDPGRDPQERALVCIRFEDRQLGRISRESGKTTRTRKIPLVHLCPSFVVDEIRLVDHSFDRTTGASFHLLAVVRGTLEVQWEGGREQASQGEVVCVAAQWGGYRLQAVDGPSALLRVALQGPG